MTDSKLDSLAVKVCKAIDGEPDLLVEEMQAIGNIAESLSDGDDGDPRITVALKMISTLSAAMAFAALRNSDKMQSSSDNNGK